MRNDHFTIHRLLETRTTALPPRGFDLRIIAAAQVMPQQGLTNVADIIPSLFRDFGVPLPLLLCTWLVGLGFFIGLGSPDVVYVTDVISTTSRLQFAGL